MIPASSDTPFEPARYNVASALFDCMEDVLEARAQGVE